MKEDLLHFIWRYQKFSPNNLKTTTGLALQVLSPGFLNEGVGPDFSNAKIQMDELFWIGPVELHVNASSWYQHAHHNDPKYDAVILHVVWNDDIDVCLSGGKALPTLCLSHYVDQQLLSRYQSQFSKNKKFITCEKSLHRFEKNKWIFWKERLYVERLEGKTTQIQALLKQTTNNWDAVLFQLLAKGFGLNKNGITFLEMAQSIPFYVIQKCQHDVFLLEALLFGQLGLLEEDKEGYHLQLKKEYEFLKLKFKLKKRITHPPTFGRLRPANFPTVRIAQLAQLYHHQKRLFKKFMESESPKEASQYLKCSTSTFWNTHYTFHVKSKEVVKTSSHSFRELLLINVVIPLRFAYFKYQGKAHEMRLVEWANEIKAEQNSTMQSFKMLNLDIQTVFDSQSLLHLKKTYCNLQKCLRCSIGFHIMQKDS